MCARARVRVRVRACVRARYAVPCRAVPCILASAHPPDRPTDRPIDRSTDRPYRPGHLSVSLLRCMMRGRVAVVGCFGESLPASMFVSMHMYVHVYSHICTHVCTHDGALSIPIPLPPQVRAAPASTAGALRQRHSAQACCHLDRALAALRCRPAQPAPAAARCLRPSRVGNGPSHRGGMTKPATYLRGSRCRRPAGFVRGDGILVLRHAVNPNERGG